MRNRDFRELLQGVRQMKAILRGELEPAARRSIEPLKTKTIRARLGLSQAQFSQMIGVPTATLRNWEQGRTQPDGPARALLTLASRNPRAVLEALHPRAARKHA